MNSLTVFVVILLLATVFFSILFFVVRPAVKQGVQMAFRADLLNQRALGHTDVL